VDCLSKAEAEERFRFAPEGARFCPDCLTELRKIDSDKGGVFYCTNEMCMNNYFYNEEGIVI